MSSEDVPHFVGPWQPKEVLDPEVESQANQSIIEMVFEYYSACICHVIMTNYTWKPRDISQLLPHYEGLGEEWIKKLDALQKNMEPESFKQVARKYGLLDLPIYSKCVDLSKIESESLSRVYHDPKEFLSSGSALEPEVSKFVCSVMKKVLEPFFTPKEIKKVVNEPVKLISTLMESRKRDEAIGIDKELDYGICKLIEPVSFDNFPDFHQKVSGSVTNFLAYVALHTIRHHCYVSFGVDGELKVFQREMYRTALEDLRNAKTNVSSGNLSSIKPESGRKSVESNDRRPVKIKAEKKDDSDEDFCEILEPPTKKNKTTPSKTQKVTESKKDTQDFPEKYMLEDLDKDALPMYFKSKFRKLVEQNQMLRDEINDFKELIQLKIAEKKRSFQ